MAKKKGSPASDGVLERGFGEWLIAAYQPVSVFSLRMTHATSKGGKTLVVPTPYALKMALLDACFRRFPPSEADNHAHLVFEWIKSRDVRLRPPKQCVVNNTFVKVLDWNRDSGAEPFKNTIAYREVVFFGGDDLLVALGVRGLDEQQRKVLMELFAHINSLGKRGGFWQFTGVEDVTGELPYGFTVARDEMSSEQIMSYLMTQALDDFGRRLCLAKDGFDRVSTYGSGIVRLGEHRVLRATALPYRRLSASRHFTWYQRTGEGPELSSPA